MKSTKYGQIQSGTAHMLRASFPADWYEMELENLNLDLSGFQEI